MGTYTNAGDNMQTAERTAIPFALLATSCACHRCPDEMATTPSKDPATITTEIIFQLLANSSRCPQDVSVLINSLPAALQAERTAERNAARRVTRSEHEAPHAGQGVVDARDHATDITRFRCTVGGLGRQLSDVKNAIHDLNNINQPMLDELDTTIDILRKRLNTDSSKASSPDISYASTSGVTEAAAADFKVAPTVYDESAVKVRSSSLPRERASTPQTPRTVFARSVPSSSHKERATPTKREMPWARLAAYESALEGAMLATPERKQEMRRHSAVTSLATPPSIQRSSTLGKRYSVPGSFNGSPESSKRHRPIME